MSKSRSGFTIIELLIVIVVIGILASITIVSFSGSSQRAMEVAMMSDLSNAAPQMESAKITSPGNYPGDLPAEVKPSKNVTLQLAVVADDSKDFCINATYTTKPGLNKSWDSATNSIRSYLCSGAVKGTAVTGM